MSGSAECAECGVTNRGASIVEVDGEDLCADCAAPQPCERCGRPTENTTLAGTFRCEYCSSRPTGTRRRPGDQLGLSDFGGTEAGDADADGVGDGEGR